MEKIPYRTILAQREQFHQPEGFFIPPFKWHLLHLKSSQMPHCLLYLCVCFVSTLKSNTQSVSPIFFFFSFIERNSSPESASMLLRRLTASNHHGLICIMQIIDISFFPLICSFGILSCPERLKRCDDVRRGGDTPHTQIPLYRKDAKTVLLICIHNVLVSHLCNARYFITFTTFRFIQRLLLKISRLVLHILKAIL